MKEIRRFVLMSMCALVIAGCTAKESSTPPTAQATIAPESEKVTEVAFKEMTIPYLRSRAYESSLAELADYQSQSQFTSYLTSYTSDGLKINGLITIPKGEQPKEGWPAIVFVHGYIPPTLYKTTEKYTDYVNFLARNGFVVFKIDLRGHGESEGQPGGAYYSSDYVIDTLNARAALQNASFVNPKQIGMWGHSMAGNVTLRSFVVAQDIPGLVVWAGAGYTYEDLLEYRINDNSYRPPSSTAPNQQRRRELFEKYGTFSKDNEFWKTVVPTNYLDTVNGSIELHHAINDDVVSINYSRNLSKSLDSSNIPHQLFEYPNGGHNISGSSFTQAMQRTVAFFKKTLTNQ